MIIAWAPHTLSMHAKQYKYMFDGSKGICKTCVRVWVNAQHRYICIEAMVFSFKDNRCAHGYLKASYSMWLAKSKRKVK